MKVALKELRESFNCLRIIKKMDWNVDLLAGILNENNQLISIFVTSIKTAQKNLEEEKSKNGRNKKS